MTIKEASNAMDLQDQVIKRDSPLSKWYESVASVEGKKKLLKLNDAIAMVNHCLQAGVPPEIKAAESIKSMDRAKALKEQGTLLFKEGDMRGARDAYTESLKYFPLKEDDPESCKEYSVILANRSATLDAGRMYEACIQDIDYAFKYGYPKHLQFKIYKRKGHALLKLKQYITSKEAFTKCLDMIGKSDMNSKLRDKTRETTKKQMNVFTVVKQLRNESMDDKPAFKLTREESAELGGASTGIVVNVEGNLIANADLAFAEVTTAEAPVAHILLEGEAEDRICPHTLLRMPAPVPCSLGSGLTFANENARAEAEKTYHRYEWKVSQALKEIGLTEVGRLALRLVTSMAPAGLEKVSESGESALGRAFSLLEIKPVSNDEAVLSAAVAACLVRALRVSGYCSGQGENLSGSEHAAAKALYAAVTIALRHAMSITILDPSQLAKPMDVFKRETFPARTFAIGIFPAASKLRTCAKAGQSDDEPDAFVFFHGGKLISLMNKGARKGQALKLVSAVDPDESKEEVEVINEMITFRCSNEKCEVGFPLRENTKEKVITCPMGDCAKETNVWLKLKRIQELKKLRREQVAKNIEKEDWTEVVENLRYLVAEWEKIVCRPYKEFANLEKELRFALILQFLKKESDWAAARI